MSVIAQAIADRQHEIGRLQTEIKGADRRRAHPWSVRPSVPPSSPLAHLMGAMAGSGAARRLSRRGKGRRGIGSPGGCSSSTPKVVHQGGGLHVDDGGNAPDTVTDSASVAKSSAASMLMALLPSTITPFPHQGPEAGNLEREVRRRPRPRAPGWSGSPLPPATASPCAAVAVPPISPAGWAAAGAAAASASSVRPQSRQITMRSISSTVTVSAVRS